MKCSTALAIGIDSPTSVSTANAMAKFVGNWVDDYNYRLKDNEGGILPGVFFDIVGSGSVLKVWAACDSGEATALHLTKILTKSNFCLL